MECPFCRHPRTRVVSTRRVEGGAEVRRRRVCPACGEGFNSHERPEVPRAMIRKRDGRLEPFSASKVEASIRRACKGRPLAGDEKTLGAVFGSVQRRVYGYRGKVVSSEELARFVAAALKEVDEEAARRFVQVREVHSKEGLPVVAYNRIEEV